MFLSKFQGWRNPVKMFWHWLDPQKDIIESATFKVYADGTMKIDVKRKEKK